MIRAIFRRCIPLQQRGTLRRIIEDIGFQPRAPSDEIQQFLERYQRREQLSVWTAVSFREFLLEVFRWSEAKMNPVYKV